MTALPFAAAAYDLGFAAFHLLFWRVFGWPASLQRSGALNTAITQTLNLVLIYVFVAAAISIALSRNTALLGAAAGFWALRAVLQPALFKLPGLAQAAMTGLFALGAALHGLAAALG